MWIKVANGNFTNQIGNLTIYNPFTGCVVIQYWRKDYMIGNQSVLLIFSVADAEKVSWLFSMTNTDISE